MYKGCLVKPQHPLSKREQTEVEDEEEEEEEEGAETSNREKGKSTVDERRKWVFGTELVAAINILQNWGVFAVSAYSEKAHH